MYGTKKTSEHPKPMLRIHLKMYESSERNLTLLTLAGRRYYCLAIFRSNSFKLREWDRYNIIMTCDDFCTRLQQGIITLTPEQCVNFVSLQLQYDFASHAILQ